MAYRNERQGSQWRIVGRAGRREENVKLKNEENSSGGLSLQKQDGRLGDFAQLKRNKTSAGQNGITSKSQ
jgi:hypothetical protein